MMLRRANGATVDEVMTATGWQRHTVRGMVSAALKKKLGLNVTSTKEKRGRRDFPRARARVAHGARGLQLKGRRSTEWDPPPQVRFARTHRWSPPGGAVRSGDHAGRSRPLRASSQWTLSWREMDSNFRFRCVRRS